MWGFYQWRQMENASLQQAKAQQAQAEADKNKAEAAAQTAKSSRTFNLNACLATAQTTYSTNWTSLCKALGKADNCLLMQTQADSLALSLTNSKNDCFRLYPQN
jgi:membrane protease subunit (stomatin/prohibitin family)